MTAKAKLENSKDKSTWGGARQGAGRPKGTENRDTKFRREQKARFQERVAKNVDQLFNAQLNLAMGERYLMVERREGEGKNRKVWHEIVSDPEMIVQYLDGDLANTDEEYYYMSTKPADNKAIDSLLDRAFGKPEQKMDLGSSDGSLTPQPAAAANPELAAAFLTFIQEQTKSKPTPKRAAKRGRSQSNQK